MTPFRVLAMLALLLAVASVVPTPVGFSKPEATDRSDLDDWLGRYEFTESIPPEVPDWSVNWDEQGNYIPGSRHVGRFWVYTLDVYKEPSGYYAYVNVDGRQTMTRLIAEVDGDDERIRLTFKEHPAGETHMPDNYESGDLLLELAREGGELRTYWFGIRPRIEANEPQGGAYFVKSE